MTSGRTLTLLFTDIVGSTSLTARLGEDEADKLWREHFDEVGASVAECGGTLIKTLGDGAMATFESCACAIDCAARLQRDARALSARSPAADVEIRIGLSVGEVFQDGGDYFGSPVLEAERLCDAAAGGQILASDLVRRVAGDRSPYALVPIGDSRPNPPGSLGAICEARWREDDTPAASH